PVARMDLERLGLFLAGRVGADFLSETHLQRVVLHESYNTVIFDVNTGHAIAGGGHDKTVVESQLEWSGLDLAVPIHAQPPKAEVPFSDDCCFVSRLLEDAGGRRSARLDDQGGISRKDASAAFTPGVFPCKQRVSGWRAGCGGAVSVG